MSEPLEPGWAQGLVLRDTPDGVTIPLRVQAGTSRTEIAGISRGAIKLRLTAPPERGQANDQCIAFFTELFQVSQAKIKIIRGQYGREKLILVSGMRSVEVLARLDPTPRPQ